MKKIKNVLFAFGLVSLTACAQKNAIDPVGELFVYTAQRPSTTFFNCEIYTKTIYVQGHAYVVTGLKCRDDQNNWVVIN